MLHSITFESLSWAVAIEFTRKRNGNFIVRTYRHTYKRQRTICELIDKRDHKVYSDFTLDGYFCAAIFERKGN